MLRDDSAIGGFLTLLQALVEEVRGWTRSRQRTLERSDAAGRFTGHEARILIPPR